jgi:hypothetical protein
LKQKPQFFSENAVAAENILRAEFGVARNKHVPALGVTFVLGWSSQITRCQAFQNPGFEI